MNTSSRRQFMASVGVGLMGGLLGHSGVYRTSGAEFFTPCSVTSRQARYPIRLGGPIFNAPEDPEELALAHRKLGYSAAYCPHVHISDAERIRDIRYAFDKHKVVIAEVGRWCNLMEADPDKRRQNLERVCEGLALADELGALCCVNIAGSFNEQVWFGPHPKNLSQEFFDLAVENARRIIDSVKPKRAKFCYEMMGWALPDSPDSCLEMLRAVNREAFAVHLDPCNLVNSPRRFYENTQLLHECFDKLGPWIVSCHAKDVAWVVEMQVHFREVVIGTGSLDYRTYLERLAALPHQPPLMMEHMAGPDEYEQSKRYILSVGQEVGVSFA
jgi:sugar phosphate isomerase/epimerase